MKFCTKCGAPCAEDAAFCVACGNSLAHNTGAVENTRRVTAEPLPVNQDSNVGTVFYFVFDICLMLSIAFAFLSVFLAQIYCGEWYTCELWFNSEFLVFSFLLSFPILAFGIVSFVFGLKSKGSLSKKLGGIFRFVTGNIVFLATFIAMVCCA